MVGTGVSSRQGASAWNMCIIYICGPFKIKHRLVFGDGVNTNLTSSIWLICSGLVRKTKT